MAAEQTISIYKTVKDITGQEYIPVDLFFEGVKSGKWQDIVLPIRTIKDKKQREEAKKKVPLVTLSGQFYERKDDALIKHSGLVGIDLDNLDSPEQVKEQLKGDRYIVAMFTSIGGRGLCVVFSINPAKHREAFEGIQEYLFNNYAIPCDPTSINISRARFVSYDPYIYMSDNFDKFTIYPKVKAPKKVERVIFAKNDFENIIREINMRRLNLCDSYHDWLRIGFSLAHEFKEGGREYFHIVSQHSSKYNSKSTDKQYDACLKQTGRRESTIATFYYYCKSAGIPLYSEETKIIVHTASQGRKAGLSQQQVAANLQKFENITGAESIIEQVFNSEFELDEDTIIAQLEIWLRQNYDFKRNAITRYIESGKRNMESKDFNSIFIAAKKIFPELSFDLLDRLINSDFVPTYNPLLEFIEENKHRQPSGCIDQLWDCIETKDSEWVKYFGKKWLVSMIASINGEHSPLMVVLSGETQNTGKTEFFRRLLPEQLRKFYAESKLDREKDDEILMTQKLIIMDDEMGGKSKKENKRLKELTSKQVFTLREPYGRNNVDLVRLALLCGTSNDDELLNDPTGNRRIIPVKVYSINHDKYNSIDKVDLFIEAYHLWASGYSWRLNKDDINYLGVDKVSFEIANLEKELLQKYFIPGDEHMTASDIKIYLEDKTRQKLILDKIGKELKALGFAQKKIEHGTRRVYCVGYKLPQADDLPF